MLDLRWVVANLDEARRRLAARGAAASEALAPIEALAAERRQLIQSTETQRAKQHTEIGERLGLLDFERAAKVSGARFAFYRGALARLELAVVQFFLDSARERGYLELLPPYLVNADSMRGTGQLPKFEEDLFKTTAGYYLIPTAEVPVTNYHRDEILPDLPLKYCAFSPCFRSEAGSYGKDTKGIV